MHTCNECRLGESYNIPAMYRVKTVRAVTGHTTTEWVCEDHYQMLCDDGDVKVLEHARNNI